MVHRLATATVKHLENWRMHPSVVHRPAHAKDRTASIYLELQQIRAVLFQRYSAECFTLMIHPVSRALFYRTFSGKGYKNKTAKSCLCAQCFAGREAFQQLAVLVDTICSGLPDVEHAAEQLKQRLSALHRYIRIDFPTHLARSSDCSTHCTVFALSQPGKAEFHSACDHQHDTSCRECNERWHILDDIAALAARPQPQLSPAEQQAAAESRQTELASHRVTLQKYMGHKVRSKPCRARNASLSDVHAMPDLPAYDPGSGYPYAWTRVVIAWLGSVYDVQQQGSKTDALRVYPSRPSVSAC